MAINKRGILNISEGDVHWARENMNAFKEQWERPDFRLATECLTTHQHIGNVRYGVTAV